MSEKTEAPTPRKRDEARQDGTVAHSPDLTAAISLFGGVLLLGWFGWYLLWGLKAIMQAMLAGERADDMVRTGDLAPMWFSLVQMAGEFMAPLALGLFALAILANLFQVGFLLTIKPLQPKFSKLSPLRGIKQLFSLKSLMKLAMSLLKVGILMTVAAISVYFEMDEVIGLARLPAIAAFSAAAHIVYILAMRIAITLLILAILDYSYQKWQHEQDLKMSKEEVKEDFKRMEGDPLIKQRRAKVARQLAMQRIGQAVPNADVIVTNPTHYAIALQYKDDMTAPKVVAKGADYLALRIRQIAIASNIPIVERKPLARALYRTVEVGQEIPPEHYAAVAEILAYVYRINNKRSA